MDRLFSSNTTPPFHFRRIQKLFATPNHDVVAVYLKSNDIIIEESIQQLTNLKNISSDQLKHLNDKLAMLFQMPHDNTQAVYQCTQLQFAFQQNINDADLILEWLETIREKHFLQFLVRDVNEEGVDAYLINMEFIYDNNLKNTDLIYHLPASEDDPDEPEIESSKFLIC